MDDRIQDVARPPTERDRSEGPLVSIIMAAHNAERTLKRAVASALDQTLQDIEVVIVDDASEDGTFALACRLAETDPRIVVLRLTVNCGPGAARNAGITASRGHWIASLDADDAFVSNRLECLIAFSERDGADFFADNIEMWSDKGQAAVGDLYANDRLFTLSPLTITAFLEASDRLPALGLIKPIMRRAFLDRHGIRYATDIRCGEDWLLYAQALLADARFCITPDAYYRYTVDSGGISQDREQRLVANFSYLLTANERLSDTVQIAGRPAGAETDTVTRLLTRRRKDLLRQRRAGRLKKLVFDRPVLRALVDYVRGRKT